MAHGEQTRRAIEWFARRVTRGARTREQAMHRFFGLMGSLCLVAVPLWTYAAVHLRLNFGIGIDLLLLIMAWYSFSLGWRKDDDE